MTTNAVQSAKQSLLQISVPADHDVDHSNNHSALVALMDRVLPLSDFVCRISQQYPQDILPRLYALSKDLVLPEPIDYKQQLASALCGCEHENTFYEVLRQFRQVHMASIAIYDLLHLQDIQASMRNVSHLADAIIECAYLWIYQQHSNIFGRPENHQHMQIMGMGKLGGGELNFSSDIDLIFVYPKSGNTVGAKKSIEHQKFFTKIAQKLIYALDHITEHGRCYRVDMRLRPMGDSGPLVMPYSAVESYYQEQGRPWERFAMQKMRVININDDTDALYELIHPFVYRKYIDFTTIDAIREMKMLIEKEVRRRQLTQNIKLGQGGIREVEFFAQAMQLIHAGREPRCQQVSTLGALDALCTYQFISPEVRNELKQSYLYLRRIEHYLQMFGDEQTQLLPQDERNQQRLVSLFESRSYEHFLSSVEQCMSLINMHFSTIIDDANESQDEADTSTETDELSIFTDIWNLSLSKEEVVSLLAPILLEPECEILSEHIQQFKQKLQNTSVSDRGMRSINRLMPLLLSELHIQDKQLNHNQINGIFGILLTITGRITYIDLLLENPDVRHRLHSLSRKSLWVAQEISQHPVLLDELLHPVYLRSDELSLPDWKMQCAQELKQYMLRIEPDDVEAVMDTLRQFKHAYQLRIAAADITGTIAINQVSDKLTLLAEVILAEVVEQAWRQVTLRHGVPQGKSHHDKGFGIVAYGKFGGIELSYGSDLDIVCLYDAGRDGQTDDSGAHKSLSHQEFYIKLVQKITHYCITKTYHGILYDIDLRLRPSGNSGLLITHISSFADYQSSTAWTWEHQALVRARLVNGSEDFNKTFLKVRAKTLSMPRDGAKLKSDVAQMREKMRDHLDKTKEEHIDIKQCTGGIVDIEFLVQFWILNLAAKHPELSRWSDNLRLLDMCGELHVIDAEMVSALQAHYLWMRHLAHRLQLSGRALAGPSEQLTQVRREVTHIYRLVFDDTPSAGK